MPVATATEQAHRRGAGSLPPPLSRPSALPRTGSLPGQQRIAQNALSQNASLTARTRAEPAIQGASMAEAARLSRLEVHLLFAADTTLAAVLAAAGLRPSGRIGTAEVWLNADPDPPEGGEVRC